MSNHIHLAIQVGQINLSRIMQNLSFRYTRRKRGLTPFIANVLFCSDHVPATKKLWEEKLKAPGSSWSDQEPKVYQYKLVGQGIPKANANL